MWPRGLPARRAREGSRAGPSGRRRASGAKPRGAPPARAAARAPRTRERRRARSEPITGGPCEHVHREVVRPKVAFVAEIDMQQSDLAVEGDVEYDLPPDGLGIEACEITVRR